VSFEIWKARSCQNRKIVAKKRNNKSTFRSLIIFETALVHSLSIISKTKTIENLLGFISSENLYYSCKSLKVTNSIFSNKFFLFEVF
jgi:hypothetical protein